MKTLLLERDQGKPTTYQEDGGFFVVSRLCPEEKESNIQKQNLDVTNRQVFHEFDKLTNQQAINGRGSTPGRF